jgi:hypothetical protein
MALDLWDQSSEDMRERWRDIARALRDTGDAEALPRALQTAFWFGVEAVTVRRSASGAKFDATLRNLLPPERIELLRAASASRTSTPRV